MTGIMPSFAKQAVRNLQRYASELRETYKEATFRPYITKKRIDGIDFDFYIGDPTGQLWYDSGVVAFSDQRNGRVVKAIRPFCALIPTGCSTIGLARRSRSQS